MSTSIDVYMQDYLSTNHCPICGGTGHEFDNRACARLAQTVLDQQDITRKDLARLIGVSPQYLGDVMKGRRRWTPYLVEQLMRNSRKPK